MRLPHPFERQLFFVDDVLNNFRNAKCFDVFQRWTISAAFLLAPALKPPPATRPPSAHRQTREKTNHAVWQTCQAALGGEKFDAVFDMNAREVSDTKAVADVFVGKVDHYVFMSSAGVYLKSELMPHREVRVGIGGLFTAVLARDDGDDGGLWRGVVFILRVLFCRLSSSGVQHRSNRSW